MPVGTSFAFLEYSRLGLLIKKDVIENTTLNKIVIAVRPTMLDRRHVLVTKCMRVKKLYIVHRLRMMYPETVSVSYRHALVFVFVAESLVLTSRLLFVTSGTRFHVGPNCVCLTRTRNWEQETSLWDGDRPRPDIARSFEQSSAQCCCRPSLICTCRPGQAKKFVLMFHIWYLCFLRISTDVVTVEVRFF
jgi:hypothetical protein